MLAFRAGRAQKVSRPPAILSESRDGDSRRGFRSEVADGDVQGGTESWEEIDLHMPAGWLMQSTPFVLSDESVQPGIYRLPADLVHHLSAEVSGTQDPFAEAIRQLCSNDRVRRIAFDMETVEQLGSVGLNRLIRYNRLARQAGVGIVLTNVQPLVGQVLSLTRLERLFETHPSGASVSESPRNPV